MITLVEFYMTRLWVEFDNTMFNLFMRRERKGGGVRLSMFISGISFIMGFSGVNTNTTWTGQWEGMEGYLIIKVWYG